MKQYRLFTMTGMGKVGRVETINAEDDAEAVHSAYEMKLPVDCEIWDGDRLVSLIPAQPFH
jgi:hypothetical protein